MASSTPLAFEPPSTLSVHQGLLPSTNRRDWAYHIGSLTAKDRIVFSKESLIGFLKVHGIDVGPNCTELSALPRFSVVGKFNESATPAAASSAAPEISSLSINDSSLEAPRPAPSAPTSTTSQRTSDSNPQSQQAAFQEPGLTRGIVVDRTDASGEAWKPTRRVREAIGGGSAQIGALFGGDEHDDDQALKDAEAQVRARRLGSNNENTTSQPQTHVNKEPIRQAQPQPQQGGEKWKPTRRVREDVGGGSAQIGALFGGDEDEDALREAEAAVRARRGGGGVQPPAQDHQPQKFIPSRRVREPGGTGGSSSITFD